MKDGDFLQGPAKESVQKWWMEEDDKILVMEVVDVDGAISQAGTLVRECFDKWFTTALSDARDRLRRGVKSKLPLLDSTLLAFDPSNISSEICVDVATGVEALFGDFGAAQGGYGVGQITAARLGVLALAEPTLWRKLIRERADWADPIPFYRSLFRNLVHPGSSSPTLLFSEEVDSNNQSNLSYELWFSKRPHSLRTLARLLPHLGYPDLDLLVDDPVEVQATLWGWL